MNDGETPAAALQWPRALLFDLDGTLVDSAPDIAVAINKVLAQQGLAALPVARVRSMIGNGVRKLVERAFLESGQALDGTALDAMTDHMMCVYARHLTVLTVEMPGALRIVEALANRGVKIAVVTNKPEAFSREILEALGFSAHVACVVGGDTGPERKPAPDMLLHACRMMGVAVSDAVMVGDSPADIGAALNARMTSVAVRGGYTNVPVEDLGADLVIGHLHALEEALGRLKPGA